MLSLFQTIRSLMFIRTNEMLMKVNNPLFGTIQVTFMKETWPSISFSFFVKDSNKNSDRASGVQDRNQDVNSFQKWNSKIVLPWTWWCSSRSWGPRGSPSRPCLRHWRWRRSCRSRSRGQADFVSLRCRSLLINLNKSKWKAIINLCCVNYLK